MNLHRSGVEGEGFDPDPHDLLQLHLFKHAVQYSVFGPPAHAHVDRMPAAEPLRKPPPFAALFRHIQNREVPGRKSAPAGSALICESISLWKHSCTGRVEQTIGEI